MIADRNGLRYSFIGSQLAITCLVMLIITGCKSTPNGYQPGELPGRVLAQTGPASDTPIVISGGSMQFRARGENNVWQACDGNSPPKPGTTCYMVAFTKPDKINLNYYQFLDSSFGLDKQGANTGWEIDVVDFNPGNPSTAAMQAGVKICAESLKPFTSCTLGSFTSGFVYVIAIGGTFEVPNSAHPRKLVYHDVVGNTDYDSINDIRLNVTPDSPRGSKDEDCTTGDHYCALFFSK